MEAFFQDNPLTARGIIERMLNEIQLEAVEMKLDGVEEEED